MTVTRADKMRETTRASFLMRREALRCADKYRIVVVRDKAGKEWRCPKDMAEAVANS